VRHSPTLPQPHTPRAPTKRRALRPVVVRAHDRVNAPQSLDPDSPGQECHDAARGEHRPGTPEQVPLLARPDRPFPGMKEADGCAHRSPSRNHRRSGPSEKHIDLGSPGASTRAEYQRRRDADERRRRRERFGRLLGPVIAAVAGERRSTTAWERGGVAEERVGAYLTRAVGERGLLLHDRSIPGSRSNIDHLAVVPSGVWVIDTKRYAGRVQRRNVGMWLTSRPLLVVNGRDRTRLVRAVRHQVTRVSENAGNGVPLYAVLCFSGSRWEPWARPFVIDQVIVTWAGQLAKTLRGPGPLDPRSVRTLAAQLAVAFPSYPATTRRRYTPPSVDPPAPRPRRRC